MTIPQIETRLQQLYKQRKRYIEERNLIQGLRVAKEIETLEQEKQKLITDEQTDLDELFDTEERFFLNLCISKILLMADIMEATNLAFVERLAKLETIGKKAEHTFFYRQITKVQDEVKALRQMTKLFEYDKVQEAFGDCCDELDELVTNKAKKYMKQYIKIYESELKKA